jgi:pyruvate dehydrogenase complex dehydrogenase (E1) component
VRELLEKEDLQAIAELMKRSIGSAIGESEMRMKDYIDTSVGSKISESETRMKAYIDTSVAASENRMKAYIEQTSEKQIKILAEGYHDLYKRLPAAEDQERLKGRVSVLEHAVKGMRVEIDELKKA